MTRRRQWIAVVRCMHPCRRRVRMRTIVVGDMGAGKGTLCGHCAYWCDGNVVARKGVPSAR